MIDVPLIDELREVRRRLAEACGCDMARYVAMLRARATGPDPRAASRAAESEPQRDAAPTRQAGPAVK